MVLVPNGKRKKVEIVIHPKPADDDWLIRVLRELVHQNRRGEA